MPAVRCLTTRVPCVDVTNGWQRALETAKRCTKAREGFYSRLHEIPRMGPPHLLLPSLLPQTFSPRPLPDSTRALNNNIRWSCVFIDWWIWWIWLHQIFLAPWGSFRWDMQTLSHHTGTLCLGRLTLSCGMWALITWRRTKCRSRPLGARSLKHWTSKEGPELILL